MSTANSLKIVWAFLQGKLGDKLKTGQAFYKLGQAAQKEGNRTCAQLNFEMAKKLSFQGDILEPTLPGTFEDLIAAADTYLAHEDPEMTLTCLKKAAELKISDGVAWFEIAQRYYEARDRDSAVEAYRTSIKLLPNVMSYLGLATIYEKTNELSKAAPFADYAARNFPDVRAHRVLAACELRDGKEKASLARLQDALPKTKDPAEMARFLNLIGKVQDKLGNIDEAYAAFQGAKDAQKQTPEYVACNQNYILGSIDLYKTIDLVGLPKFKGLRAGDEPKQLVFFIGFPRSGTTLVQQIMDAHGDVRSIEERSILTAPLKLLQRFDSNYPACLARMSLDTAKYLRKYYFLEAAKHVDFGPGHVLVDKMPLNAVHLPAILTLFPDAKILFGLRHPYASCLSNLMQDFELNPAMASLMSLDEITAAYAAIMDFRKKVASAHEFDLHFVRYEDVVADLESQARDLIDFLGLQWSDAILDYRTQAKKKGVITTPSYHQVIQPLYKTSLRHWKNYEKFFEPFQKRLAPYMEEFGYQ